MPSISQLIPPFPSHLPTASLEVFDFDRLLENDPDETQRLFATCKDKGFFYLKNHNVDVLSAFQFGKDLMDIPLEEKQKYAMGTGSNYMGYKAIGGIVVDKKGTPDSNETWNFAKDDIFEFSPSPRPQPTVVKENSTIIKNHITSCQKITSTILEILSQQLNLPKSTLPSLHEFHRPAGNQMRIIKSAPSTPDQTTLVAGPHTDFGSLTVLFNNIGGLQVFLSPEEGWKWVPPVPGCAIINLGDAMVAFTNGLFRSATHRVARPPVEHIMYDRYSVVYFERPNNDVKMGPVIGDVVGLEEYPTAGEWIARRVVGGKTAHYKGEKAYMESRGTEPIVAV